jgi:hypothetical protein
LAKKTLIDNPVSPRPSPCHGSIQEIFLRFGHFPGFSSNIIITDKEETAWDVFQDESPPTKKGCL